jgi:SPP1 family phage portal protein
MVAFSRQYTLKDEEGKDKILFETYTADKIIIWEKTSSDWELIEGYPKVNPFGKIPVIYAQQEETEWADVQTLIDRLETLTSNFAETNDYHADPKITVTGEITGWAQKGEAGAIIEMEKGAEAKYLSWEHAPESVKLEVETLLKFIYSLTQTPDVSFESVKGLTSLSGIALKILFTDAHLKVQDKREILDEYLQRRINLLQAMLLFINSSFKEAVQTLEIVPEIVPFTITSDADTITNLVTANGGKPIISQKTAIQTLGWAKDADEELRQIQDEEAASGVEDVFNTSK